MNYRNTVLNDNLIYELVKNPDELRAGTIFPTESDNGEKLYVPFVKIVEPKNGVTLGSIVENITEEGAFKVGDTGEVFFIIHDPDVYKEENWEVQYSTEDINSIIKDVNSTDITSATNAPFLSSCGSNKFIPIFFGTDNILNTAMKTALVYKGINIENYRPKFLNTSDFNNNRRHLVDEKYSSLSMSKFEKLCDVFDFEYEIIIRDKPESKNPMGREISIHSDGTREGADDIDMYIQFLRDGNEDEEIDEDE